MSEPLDHRRLQRTLFRMQMDPAFAERLRGGDGEASASTGLRERELALLRDLPAAGVEADRGGTRRRQVLGNVASEFEASVAHRARAGGDAGAAFLDGFAASPEFHAALAAGERLPHAFGEYARRRAGDDPVAAALAALEQALVELRRADHPRPVAGPEEWVLSPRAHLIELPAGLVEYAEAVRAGEDDAPPVVDDAAGGPSADTVLLHALGPVSTLRLREVLVEPLQGPVAVLLAAAREPLAPARRAAIARGLRADPSELEAFGQTLVEEGLLR